MSRTHPIIDRLDVALLLAARDGHRPQEVCLETRDVDRLVSHYETSEAAKADTSPVLRYRDLPVVLVPGESYLRVTDNTGHVDRIMI